MLLCVKSCLRCARLPAQTPLTEQVQPLLKTLYFLTNLGSECDCCEKWLQDSNWSEAGLLLPSSKELAHGQVILKSRHDPSSSSLLKLPKNQVSSVLAWPRGLILLQQGHPVFWGVPFFQALVPVCRLRLQSYCWHFLSVNQGSRTQLRWKQKLITKTEQKIES